MANYSYDYRQAAAKAQDVRAARDSIKRVIKTLSEADDYLYEGATPSAIAKALGVVTTAERLMGGVRENLEKLKK